MEDEEEVRGMLPPVAASLESRSKHKMVLPSIGNRGGRGRGRGSVAAKSTSPLASISVETDTVCIFLDALICRRCSLECVMCVIRVNMCNRAGCHYANIFMFIHVSICDLCNL